MNVITKGSRRRTNLSLDAGTRDLLDRVGNASEYISRTIQDRWQSWQESLHVLREGGWRRPEVFAVCDTLNGVWMFGQYRSPGSVAMELEDAERLNGICAKWELDPAAWRARIREVADDWPLTLALLDVVAEFWRDNRACEQAIERLG